MLISVKFLFIALFLALNLSRSTVNGLKCKKNWIGLPCNPCGENTRCILCTFCIHWDGELFVGNGTTFPSDLELGKKQNIKYFFAL